MINSIIRILVIFFSVNISAQDYLQDLLSAPSSNPLITNTFKSTRVINNHSVEIFNPGHLDFRVAHRFGRLNSGVYNLYGLDQATMRIGLEYGLINNVMIGLGRSTYNKTIDGWIKYRLLHQSSGEKSIPISIVGFSSMEINTLQKDIVMNILNNDMKYPFSGRLSFCHQILIASKINRNFSLQLMPAWVHFNMVEYRSDANDIFIFGLGARCLITRRISINSEYFFRFFNQSEIFVDRYVNSFSIGVDIETGGHVFQLHLTNSLPMYESGFMTQTEGSWGSGAVHFGFNISREFNL